jgi:hypothetical protein
MVRLGLGSESNFLPSHSLYKTPPIHPFLCPPTLTVVTTNFVVTTLPVTTVTTLPVTTVTTLPVTTVTTLPAGTCWIRGSYASESISTSSNASESISTSTELESEYRGAST